jgi:UDP-N-acetylglucosamine 4,6-dehydratase
MYSTKEMAEKLGVSVQTLRNWDKGGKLKAKRKPSGRMFYTHEQYLKVSGNKKYTPEPIIDGSNVIITGSGTLATEAVGALKDVCKKIIIYSRDEHKHRKLRAKFHNASNIRYIIGDIKDKNKLISAMRNVDLCIHTAALKMIETGFYSADEVVRVNTVGTMNVAEAAIESGVKRALFISSDKACAPLNGLTYGLSKALAESVWLSYNNHSTRDTILFATRYGNVIDSANSFYDILEEQKKNGVIKITDKNMSRFYFTISEAMRLNVFAIENALGGEIFIPKLKAASLMTFVEAFAKDFPLEIIGLRGTEKIAEELISQNEMKYTYRCVDRDGTEYYKIVPPYIREPNMGWDLYRPTEKIIKPFKYTSDSKNVEQLSVDNLKKMIKK